MTHKLTIKQDKFCNRYVECGDKSEAYRYAYDCSKMKPETVNRKAVELYNVGKITARIEELQDKLQKKSDITKERVLDEFAKIAFSSIAHLHNTWIERKDFEELTDDQKACIKSIQTKVQKLGSDTIVEVEFVKIELYDKISALNSINKMLGYEAPQKLEVKQDIIKIGYK